MKITIENPLPGQEEEIVIRAENLSPKILELLQLLKTDEEKLTGYYTDGSMGLLDPDDVYYFESVDNKVFAYGEQNVAELKLRLYEIEHQFPNAGFVRISKSMILNLAKVSRFRPSVSGRFEAILQNGEKVMISRQYVPVIRKQLGL